MTCHSPDITVIVPLLNEAGQLPQLFETLCRQTGVALELILCDGGSQDGCLPLAASLAARCPFPVRQLQTPCGRGRQMNAGAVAATADLLLFLHADSCFPNDTSLLSALESYRAQSPAGQTSFCARFGLEFRRSDHKPSLAFFFYEAKARLPRAECIRGDQGFLLSRTALAAVGGFDETLPFLEDIRLAAACSQRATWLLIPAVISTSARRFESEGLRERQTLNAIIVNNALAGWWEFFERLPGLYRLQNSGGRLQLLPILQDIRRMIDHARPAWQRAFWDSTGHHVAGNAWQLFYWLDVQRTFRAGGGPDQVEAYWLRFYERRLASFFESRTAAWLAQAAVRLWLRWNLSTGTSRTGAPPAP